jgi:hypothetical protein
MHAADRKISISSRRSRRVHIHPYFVLCGVRNYGCCPRESYILEVTGKYSSVHVHTCSKPHELHVAAYRSNCCYYNFCELRAFMVVDVILERCPHTRTILMYYGIFPRCVLYAYHIFPGVMRIPDIRITQKQ